MVIPTGCTVNVTILFKSQLLTDLWTRDSIAGKCADPQFAVSERKDLHSIALFYLLIYLFIWWNYFNLELSNKIWSLYMSSIKDVCIHSFVCFPRWLAASLFFTSHPPSHAVKPDADTIAVLQTSFCLPSSSQSASALRTLHLTAHISFSLADSFMEPTSSLSPIHAGHYIQAFILSSPPPVFRGPALIPITAGISFWCDGPSESNC